MGGYTKDAVSSERFFYVHLIAKLLHDRGVGIKRELHQHDPKKLACKREREEGGTKIITIFS